MKGSRFSEEQINWGFARAEAGLKTAEYAGGTGSQKRHFTSMDGSPVARRFRVLF